MIQFSIIIPASRPDSLTRTLDSIINLDCHGWEFECLVCDNSMSDRISKIVENYSKKCPFIKYIRAAEKRSSYYARNVGVKNAKGEILCFLDDDCTVAKNWLEELKKKFDDNRISLVKTKIAPGYDNIWETTLTKKAAFYFEKNFYTGSRSIIFRTDSFAIRKAVFSEIGFFKEVLRGGDILFSKKIVEEGYKFSYLKHPPIKHYGVLNFTDFAKKAFAYGFGLATTNAQDDLFEKLTFLGNLKFRFLETPKYIGGYRFLTPLTLYILFGIIGKISVRVKIFRENPVR